MGPAIPAFSPLGVRSPHPSRRTRPVNQCVSDLAVAVYGELAQSAPKTRGAKMMECPL